MLWSCVESAWRWRLVSRYRGPKVGERERQNERERKWEWGVAIEDIASECSSTIPTLFHHRSLYICTHYPRLVHCCYHHTITHTSHPPTTSWPRWNNQPLEGKRNTREYMYTYMRIEWWEKSWDVEFHVEGHKIHTRSGKRKSRGFVYTCNVGLGKSARSNLYIYVYLYAFDARDSHCAVNTPPRQLSQYKVVNTKSKLNSQVSIWKY